MASGLSEAGIRFGWLRFLEESIYDRRSEGVKAFLRCEPGQCHDRDRTDLLAAGKLLWQKGKGGGRPRFYLYSVRREDAPERVVYVVRGGKVTEDARSSVPGTKWELLERHADRDKAAEALSRLERGSASAESSSGSRTLWAAAGCGR